MRTEQEVKIVSFVAGCLDAARYMAKFLEEQIGKHQIPEGKENRVKPKELREAVYEVCIDAMSCFSVIMDRLAEAMLELKRLDEGGRE
jgi:hypothetical protein